MTHVFVSYSRNDAEYAKKFKNHMLQLGFDVWMDDQIDYGDNWWRKIAEKIRTCGAFIVLMSDESDKSQWVELEIGLAHELKKPSFPVLLGLQNSLANSNNFSIYVRTQYADVRDGKLPNEQFFELLTKNVNNRVSPIMGDEGAIPLLNLNAQEVNEIDEIVERGELGSQSRLLELLKKLDDWCEPGSDPSLFIDHLFDNGFYVESINILFEYEILDYIVNDYVPTLEDVIYSPFHPETKVSCMKLTDKGQKTMNYLKGTHPFI